eukprot:GHVQ01024865.1.p1 GENE.GHVQ01024865.1~~GHVQ01024865.1.p1  ORF type:complete len:297 (+),score=36.89 GHVQ01024865.1:541-1431(+)
MMVADNYSVKTSHELCNPPADSVSRLAWCPDASRYLLAAASWDKTVRVWNITHMGSVTSQFVVGFTQEAPILDCCFNKEGRMLFAGGCEQKVKAYDVGGNGGQTGQVVVTHDKPVSRMRWCEQHNFLATTGWDGHLKFSDGKSDKPIFDVTMQKICAMDLKFPFVAVIDMKNELHVWNIQKMTQAPILTFEINLKQQVRDMSLFADTNRPGAGVVEIAGRCGIVYFDRHQEANKTDFTFRCHRFGANTPANSSSQDMVYAVNAIDFNRKHNSLVTAGGDGTVLLWDKDNKTRSVNV